MSPEPAGDELVATTLEGDLYALSIPSSGGLTHANIVYHTWVRSALGVCNSIVIDDLDGDGRNEVYAAGSQGIWKWRRP